MKNILIILFFFLAICNVNGQLNLTYSMGIVSSNNISTNTNPISFSGNKCLQLNTGLSTFIPTVSGAYNDNCAVDIEFKKLGVKISPNPMNDYTIIKLSAPIPGVSHLRVSILNTTGEVLDGKDIAQDLFLYGGYKLNVTNLNTGLYYLNISANKFFESFKLFKL